MKKVLLIPIIGIVMASSLQASCSNANETVVRKATSKMVHMCKNTYQVSITNAQASKVLKRFVHGVDSGCRRKCLIDPGCGCSEKFTDDVVEGMFKSMQSTMRNICLNTKYQH